MQRYVFFINMQKKTEIFAYGLKNYCNFAVLFYETEIYFRTWQVLSKLKKD